MRQSWSSPVLQWGLRTAKGSPPAWPAFPIPLSEARRLQRAGLCSRIRLARLSLPLAVTFPRPLRYSPRLGWRPSVSPPRRLLLWRPAQVAPLLLLHRARPTG